MNLGWSPKTFDVGNYFTGITLQSILLSSELRRDEFSSSTWTELLAENGHVNIIRMYGVRCKADVNAFSNIWGI